MTLPASNHPVWKIIRLGVVGLILLAMLALGYNRFDERDILTILATLGGLGSFDFAKSAATKKSSSEES